MIYTFKVPEKQLREILKSCTSYSGHLTIRAFLESAGLSWASYWTVPRDARKPLVKALYWSLDWDSSKLINGPKPTPSQIAKILREEDQLGPLTELMSFNQWWKDFIKPGLTVIIKKAFEKLSIDEFTKFANKKSRAVFAAKFGPKNFLPLLIGNPNYEVQQILEQRLKE